MSKVSFREVMASTAMVRFSSEKSGNSRSPILLAIETAGKRYRFQAGSRGKRYKITVGISREKMSEKNVDERFKTVGSQTEVAPGLVPAEESRDEVIEGEELE